MVRMLLVEAPDQQGVLLPRPWQQLPELQKPLQQPDVKQQDKVNLQVQRVEVLGVRHPQLIWLRLQ